MLIASQTILGSTLVGLDGNVGTIADLLFDPDCDGPSSSETDCNWVIRHLIVDTGTWLPGRKVLLPPAVLDQCDWQRRLIAVGLNRKQVEESPHVDNQKSVSRKMEAQLFKHYQVPYYWGRAGASLAVGGPGSLPLESHVPDTAKCKSSVATDAEAPTNLRSADEVNGYYIKATDGELGHVEELIVDDQRWAIRYVVVDTKNWLPARKVLLSPEWIDSISWSEATVTIKLTQDQIKKSPEYDPLTPVNRGYEEHLYDYYGQERYWLPR